MNEKVLKAFLGAALGLSLSACGAGDKEFIDDEVIVEDAGADAGEPIEVPVNGLFGIVYPKTGLTTAQCKPENSRVVTNAATGQDELRYFTGLYSKAQIARLSTMVLAGDSPHKAKLPWLPTADVLNDSPWNHLEQYAAPVATAVCGLKIVDDANQDAIRYALDTYESKAAAAAAGARVTHLGNCGHCSSVADLAVLLSIPDRTYRMRKCAYKSVTSEGKTGVLNCIKEFGISDGCTMIWYYNVMHMYKECMTRCWTLIDANYHTESGAMNDCMICNEEKVDDLFKVIAGRRDDAQPISMCRELPEDEWLCHNYADDFGDPESCIGVGAPKQRWTCTIGDYDDAKNEYDLDKCVELAE